MSDYKAESESEVAQSSPTLCDPMDCSLPGSSVHGIFQIRILVAQTVKRLSAVQEIWVQSLAQEDALEKEMATHSSILVWEIPWTEEPGGLYSPRGREELDTTERLHYKDEEPPNAQALLTHSFHSWETSRRENNP